MFNRVDLLDEAKMSNDSVLKGQDGVTHLGMEMEYQVQQLLHTRLKGWRFTAGVNSQCQSVCVQTRDMANYPGICRDQLDTLRLFVRFYVRVCPVVI